MRILSLILIILLQSCWMFEETPAPVVEAQRLAYASVQDLEYNYELLLNEYELKVKTLITYIHNYSYQSKLMILKKESDPELKQKRDEDILRDHEKIMATINQWRKVGNQGRAITKQLLESVYNYMSTTPISVDNINDIIERVKNMSKSINNN